MRERKSIDGHDERVGNPLELEYVERPRRCSFSIRRGRAKSARQMRAPRGWPISKATSRRLLEERVQTAPVVELLTPTPDAQGLNGEVRSQGGGVPRVP